MTKTIEVRLRVPKNSKEPLKDEAGYPLDMASVRFRKVMTVADIPRAGATMDVTAGTHTLPVTVVRADWSEDAGMVVVACQYAQRSISVDVQNALLADPEWRLVPLI